MESLWSIKRGSVVEVITSDDESCKGTVVGLDYVNNLLCLSCVTEPSGNISVKLLKVDNCKYLRVLLGIKSKIRSRFAIAHELFNRLSNYFNTGDVIWEGDSILIKHIARIEQPYLETNVMSLSTPNGRKQVLHIKRMVKHFHDKFMRKLQHLRDLDLRFQETHNAGERHRYMPRTSYIIRIGDNMKNEDIYDDDSSSCSTDVQTTSVEEASGCDTSSLEEQLNEELMNLRDITADALAELTDKSVFGITKDTRDLAKSTCNVEKMVRNQELCSYNAEVLPTIPELNLKKLTSERQANLPYPKLNNIYGYVGKRIDNAPPKTYVLKQQQLVEEKETSWSKRSSTITRAATTGGSAWNLSLTKGLTTIKSKSVPNILTAAKAFASNPKPFTKTGGTSSKVLESTAEPSHD